MQSDGERGQTLNRAVPPRSAGEADGVLRAVGTTSLLSSVVPVCPWMPDRLVDAAISGRSRDLDPGASALPPRPAEQGDVGPRSRSPSTDHAARIGRRDHARLEQRGEATRGWNSAARRPAAGTARRGDPRLEQRGEAIRGWNSVASVIKRRTALCRPSSAGVAGGGGSDVAWNAGGPSVPLDAGPLGRCRARWEISSPASWRVGPPAAPSRAGGRCA